MVARHNRDDKVELIDRSLDRKGSTIKGQLELNGLLLTGWIMLYLERFHKRRNEEWPTSNQRGKKALMITPNPKFQ